MSTSSYYQAHITRERVWFFVATLRSFEHLAFDRTCDVSTSTFEFFVSPGLEPVFLDFMQYMEQRGVVSQFVHLPNRYA